MQSVLHVGCGAQRGIRGFDGWKEVRLDIDPRVAPDIVASMTDLSGVPAASFDAVYSSHNLEHLYAHEVPVALREFRRVLREDGFALIYTPDLAAVAKLVVEGKLDEPAYVSPSGPIFALDMLYGHRPSVEVSPFMAHRTGFTARSMLKLLAAHFPAAICATSGFNLVALASATRLTDADLRSRLGRFHSVTTGNPSEGRQELGSRS